MALWDKTKNVAKGVGDAAVGASFIIPFDNKATSTVFGSQDWNKQAKQAANTLAASGKNIAYDSFEPSTFDKRWAKSGIFGGLVDGLFDTLSGGKWSHDMHGKVNKVRREV